MNKSGLVLRLAVIVIFSATSVGILSTQIFQRITYLNEVAISKSNITQLYQTVSTTASIATYLEDQDLVNEVINGLVQNDIISSVMISTDNLSLTSPNFVSDKTTLVYKFYSPFEKNRQVGNISITPNLQYIEHKAKNISYDNAVAIITQASIITLVIILVAYFVITYPIISVAKSLNSIKPGTASRIKTPKYHSQSEIGGLVSDINNLLSETEIQIEQERQLRAEVERLSHQFKLLFENSISPMILAEPSGNIFLYNNAFIDLLEKLNIPLQKNYGPYLKELFIEQKQLEDSVQLSFGNNEIASGEFELINKESQEKLWVQAVLSPAVDEQYKEHYQITLHDISKRKKLLLHLDSQANTDELTQLLNRRGAEQELLKLHNKKSEFTLLLLDLNKFKPINDIYGHNCGDEILVHVAGQLIKSITDNSIVSRWGGDEFVIIIPSNNIKEIKKILNTIENKVAKPYFLADHKLNVTVGVSIGVAMYPHEKENIQELVKAADKAMYYAKRTMLESNESNMCFYADLP
ncbi:diguanylate cyclase [Colwelliaceae bacterium 6441]